MADQYDILDIVTKAVISADTGLNVYQKNSIKNELREHIVVAYLPLNELKVVKKMHVNVNILTNLCSDGLVNLDAQAIIVRKVRKSLESIKPPVGMYWKSRIVWSESLGEAKTGFDCVNIRMEIKTEK